MSKKKSTGKNYDFLVLGAGGTGLAAAMYAARLGLRTLVLGHSHGTELPIGGIITTTHIVENYPGFTKISGPELAREIEKHALSYDLVSVKGGKALQIKKKKGIFIVKTEKTDYKTKTILFATGTRWRKLPDSVKNSSKFENMGLSYCALCDAPLYKGKTVAIIGGSDSAAKDALLLTEYAKKVYMIYRGSEIHPEPINLQRIEKNKKIEVINNTNLTKINGDEFVKGISLDRKYKSSNELNLDGVFVAIGHEPLSQISAQLGVKLNGKKEIKINHMTSETNIHGVYAAGDVTDKGFKQLITGVADGCTAAYYAYEYITKEKVMVT